MPYVYYKFKDSDATGTMMLPIQVWININTAELVLGVFAGDGVFTYRGHQYERLGEL